MSGLRCNERQSKLWEAKCQERDTSLLARSQNFLNRRVSRLYDDDIYREMVLQERSIDERRGKSIVRNDK